MLESKSNCQIINTVNYLEIKRINVDSPKDNKKEFINNKLLSKSQQRFKSGRYNVFAEEINKIALSSNDDERIQWIDLTETYAHGMSKDFIWKREKN